MCDSLAAFLQSTDDLYLTWYEGIGVNEGAEHDAAFRIWLRLRERMKVIEELNLAVPSDAPWYWMLGADDGK